MKILFIHETPRRGDPGIIKNVEMMLAAAANYVGVASPRTVHIYAVPQHEAKSTSIKMIRDNRAALMEQVAFHRPDHVVSLGSNALKAIDPSEPVLKKEHGRMRMIDICTDDACTTLPLTPTVAPIHIMGRGKEGELGRDLMNVLVKVLRQKGPLPPMEIDVVVANDAAELREALSVLEGASVIGVDVETTGLRANTDGLLAVGFGAVEDDTHGYAVVVPRHLIGNPEVQDAMWDAAWRASRLSVGHNFKFDMQFLEPEIGWAPDGAKLGDTLLLAHLLDERSPGLNSRARGSGLKDLVAQRYDHQYGFDFAEFYEAGEAADFDAMHQYLGEDVVYTARLWMDLAAEAAEEPGILEAHDTLLIEVSKTITKAEKAGAPIDREWVEHTIAKLEHRIRRRSTRLSSVITRLAPTIVVDNLLSPAQTADVFIDEWGWKPDFRRHGVVVEDDRSTDKEHVKAMIGNARRTASPLEHRRANWAAQLLKLRADVKLATTYRKSVLERIDPTTGRLHASFLLHGTATGRISSREPNLQNIPAVGRVDSEQDLAMRHAFRPGPGRVWVEVDYSQLELRVAAALSGDEAFIEVFKSGRDVHRELASSIFSKPPEEIQAAERFLAKAVSFGILYGRSAKALAGGAEMEYAKDTLGMKPWTVEQAEAFIKKFLRSYPQLEQWITDTQEFALANHYVQSPFGRRRRFPFIRDVGSVRRQAVNTPIQSAASDLCLDAMVKIDRRIEADGIDATVLFPVHDSICIEVAEGDVEKLEAICREVMERDFMGCPMKVDYEWGETWATVEKHPHA